MINKYATVKIYFSKAKSYPLTCIPQLCKLCHEPDILMLDRISNQIYS